MKTLYFDESGFTGGNLLDPDQPVFSIASSSADDHVAETILKASFPNYQGSEFKFSNIWRSGSRRSFVKFAENIAPIAPEIFGWISEKKYTLFTKMVDFLIEPSFYDRGYDFYANGFCWKLTNHLYFGVTNFASPPFLGHLLNCYLQFARNPSTTSLINFRNEVKI